MSDNLGDRMKLYESAHSPSLMPLLPAIARLDGRAFHTFTRGMDRPYDKRLVDLMVRVTESLVEDFSCRCGYTQSDEITLIWQADDFNSQLPFDGKAAKLNSILAATCTAYFNRLMGAFFRSLPNGMPVFDCRVWNVPNRGEAANVLLWRQNDATRNSIFMAAQSKFSHKQLHEKSGAEMQEMLFQEHGINWNDYPAFFKRGTFIQRRRVERPFTADEIDRLPAKHEARANPSLVIERSEVRCLELPRITQLLNREAVIFEGDDPLVAQQEPVTA